MKLAPLTIILLLHWSLILINSDILIPKLLRSTSLSDASATNFLSFLTKVNLSINEGDVPVNNIKDANAREGFAAVVVPSENAVTIGSKTSSLMSTILEMYQTFDPEDLNIRFHVIMDTIVPDLDILHRMCDDECSSCSLTYSELLCRYCCPDQFKEPMSISSFIMDHFDHLLSWLISSSAFEGLKVIFNHWFGQSVGRANDELINRQEILAFMRNFYHQQFGQVYTSVVSSSIQELLLGSEQFSSLNESLRMTFKVEDVCGFYDHGNFSRKDQGRIVGGDLVKNTTMFPWQMSLSTGWMGYLYQHR